MGKYFGTDGIRGVANEVLTAELAFKLGRAVGHAFLENTQGEKPFVIVGRDTRISGHMLENALAAGFLSVGVNVMKLGVVSTPAVAYLTQQMKANAGAMISASHNPFEDNGIKFFGANGFKLSDELEAHIEELLESDATFEHPIAEGIGETIVNEEAVERYLRFISKTIDTNLDGLHIALDCANGSASNLAPRVFSSLGAKISTIGTSPNGVNINANIGSTHPEKLAAFVVDVGADFGLAFDGDCDRVIAVDELGNIIDGDYMMFILAKAMKAQGTLKDNMLVSTVMSNLGFYKALEKAGIDTIQTGVGDRFVVEAMVQGNYALGGEQSGHIIFLEHATTGDGMLTGLHFAAMVLASGQKVSALAAEMPKFPQLLINIKVANKNLIMESPVLAKAIEEVEAKMAGNGRVLVRPSGTEELVRVMVEAETDEICEKYTYELVEIVKQLS
ncbi:MAG: phosphoglucosamine mutase [Culicoidibacterales bacterium]